MFEEGLNTLDFAAIDPCISIHASGCTGAKSDGAADPVKSAGRRKTSYSADPVPAEKSGRALRQHQRTFPETEIDQVSYGFTFA